MSGAPAAPLLTPGQVIARCRVVRFLGKGGMGEVYLADHLALQKPVALKVLPTAGFDPLRVERFLKEARTAARIEHPHVVTIYDVSRQGDVHYILMQYVEGQNLAEMVEAQGGPLPWRKALEIMKAAVEGTAAVHRHNVIHRDIKPSNIMMAKDGRVILMDFGLAREETQSDLTPSGAIMGTPAFMSPEQCKGKPLDKRSDIFSLGCTLYYLLTARYPFEGPVPVVLGLIASGVKAPKPVHVLNPYVPKPVSELVARAMAHDSRKRFPDAESLSREIDKLMLVAPQPPTTGPDTGSVSSALVETGGTELAPLELIEEPRARQIPGWAWALAGGGVGLFGLGFLTVWLFTRPGPGARPATNSDPPRTDPVAQQSKANTKGMKHIPAGAVFISEGEAALRKPDLLRQNNDLLTLLLNKELDRQEIRVEVPEFYIDPYEVTAAEYAQFIRQTGHAPPPTWTGANPPAGKENHPVTEVNYTDAQAYAAWAKKQLPTVAQWVRAFRADNRYAYPWGATWQPERANASENPAFTSTSPVTATPRDISPFGVYNLVGNAREILGHEFLLNGQKYCAIKGGDWQDTGRLGGTASNRAFAPIGFRNNQMGFRCVVNP